MLGPVQDLLCSAPPKVSAYHTTIELLFLKINVLKCDGPEISYNRRWGREGKRVFFYIPNYRKLKKHLINMVFENRVN